MTGTLARLGCCSPDALPDMRHALVDILRAELGDRAMAIGVATLGQSDTEELAQLRARAPESPVWAIVDRRPDAIVVVAWAIIDYPTIDDDDGYEDIPKGA